MLLHLEHFGHEDLVETLAFDVNAIDLEPEHGQLMLERI